MSPEGTEGTERAPPFENLSRKRGYAVRRPPTNYKNRCLKTPALPIQIADRDLAGGLAVEA